MLERTVEFLHRFTLPAAGAYSIAEDALSNAFERTKALALCASEADEAIRRACEASIAIDALTDRAGLELGIRELDDVRSAVDRLSIVRGADRPGAFRRVVGVANAYKHGDNSKGHPIASDGSILAVGLGFGLEGFGIGKMGGPEVILTQRDNQQFKLLGDVPFCIAGWLAYLKGHGASLSSDPLSVCELKIWPP